LERFSNFHLLQLNKKTEEKEYGEKERKKEKKKTSSGWTITLQFHAMCFKLSL
jgi:hypothetical protein